MSTDPKNLVLGVDFGTTNSSAAVFVDNQIKLFKVDETNKNPCTLKSSIFIGKDNQTYVGQQAIDQYIEKFEGHEIVTDFRITDEWVDILKNVEGDTTKERVIEEYEINLPGRFIMSPKRVMPNIYFTDTEVFGHKYTPEDLAGIILSRIKESVERELGHEIKSINLGRPVHFSDTGDDSLAEQRISTAAKNVGFENVTFTLEPIGAAYNFAINNNEKKLGIVFDFGGGTFDTSVVEFFPDHSIKVIANEGVYVGGNRLNEDLITAKFMPYFGRDVKWGPHAMKIPEWIIEGASRWENSVIMRKKENVDLLESIRRQADQPLLIEKLITLIRQNYGLSLFLLAEKSKIDLTDLQDFENVEMIWQKGNIVIDENINREDFRKIVWQDVGRIVQSMRQVMEKADVKNEDIDVIIKTGGSSRTFFIQELLKNIFPKAEIYENNSFTDVTAGLAVSGNRLFDN